MKQIEVWGSLLDANVVIEVEDDATEEQINGIVSDFMIDLIHWGWREKGV